MVLATLNILSLVKEKEDGRKRNSVTRFFSVRSTCCQLTSTHTHIERTKNMAFKHLTVFLFCCFVSGA